jgi:hypothetical protein
MEAHVATTQDRTAVPPAQSNVAKAPNPTGPAPLRRHLLPPSDGLRYRQLTLALGAGDDLTLTAHEMGASPEAAWGADDHEVTLSVPAQAAARLAFVLLAEQLKGRGDGLERLLALCERHGVDHELACWT